MYYWKQFIGELISVTGKKQSLLGARTQNYKDYKAKAFIFISNLVQTYILLLLFFFYKFWSIDLTTLSYKIGYETTVLVSWFMWSEDKHMANYSITKAFGWMISSSVYYLQSLIGPQQVSSCPGWWSSYLHKHMRVQTHTLVATYSHKRFIWGVLQGEVKGEKKDLD